nr:peroxidase 3-like [Ipomoea batatas]
MELISFSFCRHFHPGISCLQLIVLCLVVWHAATATPLALNFYEKTFPNVGDIVQNITWEYTSDNPELASKFLRMHFHDCFVRGCDGSILLDSTPTNKAEKDAIPNLSLAGYDVIGRVKIALEQECPGVVSYADILALVARYSVSFQVLLSFCSSKCICGRSQWAEGTATSQETSRLCLISHHPSQISQLSSATLLAKDWMCMIFLSYPVVTRLLWDIATYSATGYTTSIPNQSLAGYDVIDEIKKMGMFQSDIALLTDENARRTVDQMTHQPLFFKSFAKSMEKMGAIQVLTGTSGEIRRNCRFVNS